MKSSDIGKNNVNPDLSWENNLFLNLMVCIKCNKGMVDSVNLDQLDFSLQCLPRLICLKILRINAI